MKKLLFSSLFVFMSLLSLSQYKIVVMGSSSAAGTGLGSTDTSWPNKLSMKIQPSLYVNIARASTLITEGLPTSPDTAINVIKAYSYLPNHVWVSYPNNGYDDPNRSVAQIVADHVTILNYFLSRGVIPHIVGIQPRNTFSPTERTKLKTLDDTLIVVIGKYYVSVFNKLIGSNYLWNPALVQADGIHPNAAGHNVIFDEVWKQYLTSVAPTLSVGKDTTTVNSNIVLSYTINGLTPGKYRSVVTLYDSLGNTLSTASLFVTRNDTSSVILPPLPPPPTGNKSVKVNLYGGVNPYNTDNWNNWNIPVTSSVIQSQSFIYNDGTQSSISATLTGSNATSDNGIAYGGTMCPAPVLRYTSTSTSNRTLTIKGLNNTLQYDIELYASRPSTGNCTIFTINGTSTTVVTDNNKDNKVVFVSLVPVNGQITISISKTSTYDYLNGFTISEKIPSFSKSSSKPEIVPVIQSVIDLHNIGDVKNVILSDMLGHTIKLGPVIYISTSFLASGIYLMQVFTTKQSYKYRFMKQ
jgi:lysophospholipase L1-like esterase